MRPSLSVIVMFLVLSAVPVRASQPESKKCVPHASCAAWKANLPNLTQAATDARTALSSQDKSCRSGEDRTACGKRVGEEAGRLAGAVGWAEGRRDASKANIADYCCD